MGLFKKKQREQEPADEDLTFFTVSKGQEFRVMAREVFAELGYEVQMNADHAIDVAGREYGFWNVAANCHNAPESQWREIIRQHLERVLASVEAPDPFAELSSMEVASQTYARLYDEAHVPGLDGYPHSQFAPGIMEMLALDLPDTMAVFNRGHASKFGGWAVLRTQGLANLRALEHEQVETHQRSLGGLEACGLRGGRPAGDPKDAMLHWSSELPLRRLCRAPRPLS